MLFNLESKPEEYLNPIFDSKTGLWKIYGYHDVLTILQNPDTIVADASKSLTSLQNRSGENLQSLINILNGTLIFKNSIDHERGRNFLKQGLINNSSVLTPNAIYGRVRSVLNSAPMNKEIDAVPIICNRIPINVIGDLLGLDDQIRDELAVLNNSLVKLWDPIQPISTYINGNQIANKAIELINQYASSQQRSSVINSWFLMGEVSYSLSRTEICSLLLFLFIVGIEETSAFLGNILLILLTESKTLNPTHFSDSNILFSINEMLRFCGPIRVTAHRFFSKSIIFNGTKIPANSPIECNIENAHFDPSVFENPHIFNPNRDCPKPIVFGRGTHGCLGRRLAYLEAASLLQELSLNYELACKTTDPQWDNKSQLLRKQKELHLTLTRR